MRLHSHFGQFSGLFHTLGEGVLLDSSYGLKCIWNYVYNNYKSNRCRIYYILIRKKSTDTNGYSKERWPKGVWPFVAWMSVKYIITLRAYIQYSKNVYCTNIPVPKDKYPEDLVLIYSMQNRSSRGIRNVVQIHTHFLKKNNILLSHNRQS
jgi:hypothetical protein